MLTRRGAIVGLGSAALSGGIVTSAASLTATSTAEASLSVVIPERPPIRLTPATDPPIHVRTDANGRVTAITPGTDQRGVSRHAITRFEDLVDVTNDGDDDVDALGFEFVASSDTLDEATLADIEAALGITAGDETLAATGDEDLLTVTPHADGVLAPGETVPFGLQVDLDPDTVRGSLADLPDADYDVTLRLLTGDGA